MRNRPRHIFVLLLLTTSTLYLCAPSVASAQLGGAPGTFSRLGFGARGVAMGNAMIAVTDGDIAGYYNPALLPWVGYRHASASFGILSLDRNLNFLDFSQALQPSAGISAGIINAGVSNIDGRDADGQPTGSIKTSENQVFLGFGVRFKEAFSVGVNLKLYYYHLYTDLSSTTVGVDFGALYHVNDLLTLGATVRDINSKYKWDTSKEYGLDGKASEDAFPTLYTIGASYKLLDSSATIAAEVELSSVQTFIGRIGAEVPLIPELTVRAGIDRIDLKEKGNGVKPSFGFTVRKELSGWTPALHYAFVLEPFSPVAMHLISLSVIF